MILEIKIIERKDIIKLLYTNIDRTNITSEQIEKIYLKYPHLKSIINLVHEFLDILKNKKVEYFDIGIEKALSLEIKKVNSFVAEIQKDLVAVKNAVIYDYNNCLEEGCINKIKLIKRSMF